MLDKIEESNQITPLEAMQAVMVQCIREGDVHLALAAAKAAAPYIHPRLQAQEVKPEEVVEMQRPLSMVETAKTFAFFLRAADHEQRNAGK